MAVKTFEESKQIIRRLRAKGYRVEKGSTFGPEVISEYADRDAGRWFVLGPGQEKILNSGHRTRTSAWTAVAVKEGLL